MSDMPTDWGHFLNEDTMSLCLNYHHSQKKNKPSESIPEPEPFSLPSYTWHWSAMADSLIAANADSTVPWFWALGASFVTFAALFTLLDLNTNADVIVATRCASGLNELFEEAVAKDTSANADVASEDISRLIPTAGASQSDPRSHHEKGKDRQESGHGVWI